MENNPLVDRYDPKQSEESVRAALIRYFGEIGCLPDELSFEDYFSIRVGHSDPLTLEWKEQIRLSGRSDILVTRNGKPFVLVETKAPSVKLDESASLQGLSYARLLKEMPPYTVVTNGLQLEAYDTITGEQLSAGPTGSRWYSNGQTMSGLVGPDRDWASKHLLRHDPVLLDALCQQQVRRELEDLRGNLVEGYRYSPEIYVRRDELHRAAEDFFCSDHLVLGVIAPSGLGKTSLLCNLAEHFADEKDYFVLFFRAIHLRAGLGESIAALFEWEFRKSHSISDVARVIREVQTVQPGRLLVFVDGLDEFPGDRSFLRNELISLSRQLTPDLFRIVLSCKSLDWRLYTRTRGMLNNFGKAVYPESKDGNEPGLRLDLFTPDEVSKAWSKYSSAFSVSGSLPTGAQRDARYPMRLRIMMEVFEGREVPGDLRAIEIYEHSIKRSLEGWSPSERLLAKKLLIELSKLMVEKDLRALDPVLLSKNSSSPASEVDMLFELIRSGVLESDPNGTEVSFSQTFVLFYVYIDWSEGWRELEEPEDIVDAVRKALRTRLGMEALEFFLNSQSLKDSPVLHALIEQSPELFIESVNLQLIPYQGDRRGEAAWDSPDLEEGLTRYARTYSTLRNYLDWGKGALPPYEGEAGVWCSPPRYGIRKRSEARPELVTWFPASDIGSALKDPDPLQESLEEVGGIFGWTTALWDAGVSPEAHALNVIVEHLSRLHQARAWNDTGKRLVSERILFCLEHVPHIFVAGALRGPLWDQLKFESLEDAAKSPLDEISWRGIRMANWVARQLAAADNPYYFRTIFAQYLVLISYSMLYAKHYGHKLDNTSRYRSRIDMTDNYLKKVGEDLLAELPDFLDTNLGRFADCLQMKRLWGSRKILEIIDGPNSRETSFSLIILPDLPPGEAEIRFARVWESSLSENASTTRFSRSNLFVKQGRLTVEVGGKSFRNTRAIVNRVRSGFSHRLTNLLYDLVANEAQTVFPGWTSRTASSKNLLSYPHEHTYPPIVQLWIEENSKYGNWAKWRMSSPCCECNQVLEFTITRDSPMHVESSDVDQYKASAPMCPCCKKADTLEPIRRDFEIRTGWYVKIVDVSYTATGEHSNQTDLSAVEAPD